MFALLWAPEKGLSPPTQGAGDFSTGFLGIIAPALTRKLNAVEYKASDHPIRAPWEPRPPAEKQLVGVDIFLDWRKGTPDELAGILQQASGDCFLLNMITNRGVKVWPGGVPETFCTDHWRCRFTRSDGRAVTHRQILGLLGLIEEAGLDFIKTEHLCTFDGEPGFSLGQGQ